MLSLTTLTQLTLLSLHDNACSDRAKSRFWAAVPGLKYEVMDDDLLDGSQLEHALLDTVPEGVWEGGEFARTPYMALEEQVMDQLFEHLADLHQFDVDPTFAFEQLSLSVL